MSKHEHWPGPWHWENNGQYLTSKSGTLLGIFTEAPGLGHAAEANARLIAAAPELLDVARMLIETNDHARFRYEDCVMRARSAVAKAEGTKP